MNKDNKWLGARDFSPVISLVDPKKWSSGVAPKWDDIEVVGTYMGNNVVSFAEDEMTDEQRAYMEVSIVLNSGTGNERWELGWHMVVHKPDLILNKE